MIKCQLQLALKLIITLFLFLFLEKLDRGWWELKFLGLIFVLANLSIKIWVW